MVKRTQSKSVLTLLWFLFMKMKIYSDLQIGNNRMNKQKQKLIGSGWVMVIWLLLGCHRKWEVDPLINMKIKYFAFNMILNNFKLAHHYLFSTTTENILLNFSIAFKQMSSSFADSCSHFLNVFIIFLHSYWTLSTTEALLMKTGCLETKLFILFSHFSQNTSSFSSIQSFTMF